MQLFARKLLFKKFYHDHALYALFPTEDERQAIETLQTLLDEQEQGPTNIGHEGHFTEDGWHTTGI